MSIQLMQTDGDQAVPITTPGVGGFWGGWGLGFVPQATSFAPITVNNQVRFLSFILTARCVVSRVTVFGGTAGGTGDVGIYSATGSLLANTGAVTYSNNTATSSSLLQGAVTLNPGQYLYGYTLTDSTKSFFGTSLNFGYFVATLYGTAANAATAGVLPATLGALTRVATSIGVPGAFFEP